MAQVTVELRNLLKTDFELFDFDYTFDDKAFAQELEQAVIDHYFNYEIGQPTPDDFKRVFKRRWLQAVGYYNKLHNTTLLEYNPLINHKMSEALEQLATSSREQDSTTDNVTTSNTTDSRTEDIDSTASDEVIQTGDNTNTRTDNTQSVTNSSDTMSDYPQQAIAGGDYLSGQRITDSDTTNTGTVEEQGTNSNTTNTTSEGHSLSGSEGTTNTEGTDNTVGHSTTTGTDNTNYEKTVEGLTGRTYQELIALERDSLIRITGMVIEELKPCFILIH